MSPQMSLAEWLRTAWEERAGCPPPEAYLPAELERLDAAERRQLEEHAASCPGCAAESDLARAFESPAAASEDERREVAALVHRLERRSPARRSRLLRFPSLAGGRALRWAGLAAAAVLVAVVGVGVRSQFAPPLPELTEDVVTRSTEVAVVAPRGDVPAPPERLEWRAVDGAASYRLTVVDVDDRILWEGTAESASIAAPEALLAQLRPFVTYGLRVEALGGDGARIAWSDRVPFRIVPTAERSTP